MHTYQYINAHVRLYTYTHMQHTHVQPHKYADIQTQMQAHMQIHKIKNSTIDTHSLHCTSIHMYKDTHIHMQK